MKKVIKNPFTSIQKVVVTTLFIILILLSWSCQNKTDQIMSEPLTDKRISSNLSENSKTDPELLIGEWDAIKFAYTADGHKISDVVKITSFYLVITVAPTKKIKIRSKKL